jgi:hypothetical protein
MSEHPIEKFRELSDVTLQNIELARRAEAASLTREIRGLIYAVVQALADADVARLVREGRSLDAPPPEPGTIAGQLAKIGK